MSHVQIIQRKKCRCFFFIYFLPVNCVGEKYATELSPHRKRTGLQTIMQPVSMVCAAILNTLKRICLCKNFLKDNNCLLMCKGGK